MTYPNTPFDPVKIVADKNIEEGHLAISRSAQRSEPVGSVLIEQAVTAEIGSATIKKMSAIIVTCCDMEHIFDVGLTPPPNAEWRAALSSVWVKIPKAAAFQCPKCSEWTIVSPTPPDGRLTVTRVKSFSGEVSALLRLLLELGSCIADPHVKSDGGCGECPFCLLKIKFTG